MGRVSRGREIKPDPLSMERAPGERILKPPSPAEGRPQKSSGRSPGLGFLLGPAFPPERWHDGPSSPDTVAGQRRILTGFPNTGCEEKQYAEARTQSTGLSLRNRPATVILAGSRKSATLNNRAMGKVTLITGGSRSGKSA